MTPRLLKWAKFGAETAVICALLSMARHQWIDTIISLAVALGMALRIARNGNTPGL
jgi:hypothetical protein